MTPYKVQNLVYEWMDFSKIWAQIGSNLRKFWKKRLILLKIWCKIDPIGIYVKVTFSWKIGICIWVYIQIPQRHVPTKTKLEYPLRRPHSNYIKMINRTGFYLALLQSPQLGQYEKSLIDQFIYPKGGGLGAKHSKVPGWGRCKIIQSLGWDNILLKSPISSVH